MIWTWTRSIGIRWLMSTWRVGWVDRCSWRTKERRFFAASESDTLILRLGSRVALAGLLAYVSFSMFLRFVYVYFFFFLNNCFGERLVRYRRLSSQHHVFGVVVVIVVVVELQRRRRVRLKREPSRVWSMMWRKS